MSWIEKIPLTNYAEFYGEKITNHLQVKQMLSFDLVLLQL